MDLEKLIVCPYILSFLKKVIISIQVLALKSLSLFWYLYTEYSSGVFMLAHLIHFLSPLPSFKYHYLFLIR